MTKPWKCLSAPNYHIIVDLVSRHLLFMQVMGYRNIVATLLKCVILIFSCLTDSFNTVTGFENKKKQNYK